MWICKNCNTKIEDDTFEICWSCSTVKVSDISLETKESEIIDNNTKIIFDDNQTSLENTNYEKMNQTIKTNLFQGRTEADTKNAKFPDWDIVPPNQFINPRVKQQ